MAIVLDDMFSAFDAHWSPHVIGQLNDLHIKAVKVKGEFVWHAHADTDELFFVHKGEVNIQYRDRDNIVCAGQMFIVPKGVEHRPVAAEECEILLVEPANTINTGDAGGALTAHTEPWI
jgi:mannose-6-phosphate isomerase-like protein (cupin superfamily)